MIAHEAIRVPEIPRICGSDLIRTGEPVLKNRPFCRRNNSGKSREVIAWIRSADVSAVLLAARTTSFFSFGLWLHWLFGAGPGCRNASGAFLGTLAQFSWKELKVDSQTPAEPARRRVLEVLPKVTIESDQTSSLSLGLERGAEISGTVSYDDGSPVISSRLWFTDSPQ